MCVFERDFERCVFFRVVFRTPRETLHTRKTNSTHHQTNKNKANTTKQAKRTRQHRPKDLLAPDAHPRLDVDKHGRLDVKPARARGGAAAAGQERRAAVEAGLDVAGDARVLRLGHERAEAAAGLQRVAHADGLRALFEARAEGGARGLVDEDAARAAADLACDTTLVWLWGCLLFVWFGGSGDGQISKGVLCARHIAQHLLFAPLSLQASPASPPPT
jgi:hypothetical protein